MKLFYNMLMVILLAVLPLSGCDGTGGVGGQGINITVHQGATDTVVPPSGVAAPAGECGNNTSNITINIEDGGTLTGNPSVGLAQGEETETPKQSEPEKTPQPSPEPPAPDGS